MNIEPCILPIIFGLSSVFSSQKLTSGEIVPPTVEKFDSPSASLAMPCFIKTIDLVILRQIKLKFSNKNYTIT